MKDKILLRWLCIWGIGALLSDYVFFETKWEFPIRQICITIILILFAVNSRMKPISHTILWGLSTLAATGIVDEIQFNNHQIRMSQVLITVCVIAVMALASLYNIYGPRKAGK